VALLDKYKDKVQNILQKHKGQEMKISEFCGLLELSKPTCLEIINALSIEGTACVKGRTKDRRIIINS